MRNPFSHRPGSALAFTLIELLVVLSIIGILAAFVLPSMLRTQRQAQMAAGLSSMRQVGLGFHLYANDHDYTVPGRVTGQNVDRWPALLMPYLKTADIYASPADPKNWKLRGLTADQAIANSPNNTSYIMNGYNDLGSIADPSVVVRINRFPDLSKILLLGTPKTGMQHFYMDFEEPPHGNQKDVLELAQSEDGPETKKSASAGSNYLFMDGSARFIRKSDYSDNLWLVDKSYKIPDLGSP